MRREKEEQRWRLRTKEVLCRTLLSVPIGAAVLFETFTFSLFRALLLVVFPAPGARAEEPLAGAVGCRNDVPKGLNGLAGTPDAIIGVRADKI